MKRLNHAGLVWVLVLAAGCGSPLAGTYRADARLMEGKEESGEPRYSLEAVRERVRAEGRTLTLQPNGRFVWGPNEGTWRVEDDTLILRDDISNGNRIQPALQSDRRWRIGANGEIINPNTYGAYNIEEVYYPE